MKKKPNLQINNYDTIFQLFLKCSYTQLQYVQNPCLHKECSLKLSIEVFCIRKKKILTLDRIGEAAGSTSSQKKVQGSTVRSTPLYATLPHSNAQVEMGNKTRLTQRYLRVLVRMLREPPTTMLTIHTILLKGMCHKWRVPQG